jgi:hypothetical protein
VHAGFVCRGKDKNAGLKVVRGAPRGKLINMKKVLFLDLGLISSHGMTFLPCLMAHAFFGFHSK